RWCACAPGCCSRSQREGSPGPSPTCRETAVRAAGAARVGDVGSFKKVAFAGLAGLALTACAPGPVVTPEETESPVATTNVRPATSEPASTTPEPQSMEPGPAACSALAAGLSLPAQVGQLYMVGVSTAGI